MYSSHYRYDYDDYNLQCITEYNYICGFCTPISESGNSIKGYCDGNNMFIAITNNDNYHKYIMYGYIAKILLFTSLLELVIGKCMEDCNT